MFSVVKPIFWSSKNLLAALLCLLSVCSLGFSRAAPYNGRSIVESSPRKLDVPSKRAVTLTQPWGPNVNVWGTNLVPEPANSGWGSNDIDQFVMEGYNNVPSASKPPVFLIAALWIPNYGYTMSSSPGNFLTAKNDMKENGKTVAPAWWQKVWDRFLIDSIQDTWYHAEDGACFLYEKSLEVKLSPNAKDPGTDAQKPYMVVYGKRQQSATPGYVASCSSEKPGNSAIVPDCSEVMKDLGVDVKL
jgi:hypothetical protein